MNHVQLKRAHGSMPRPGHRFRNKKTGHNYAVVLVSLMAGEPLISYIREGRGDEIHTRLAREFLDKFEPVQGQNVQNCPGSSQRE